MSIHIAGTTVCPPATVPGRATAGHPPGPQLQARTRADVTCPPHYGLCMFHRGGNQDPEKSGDLPSVTQHISDELSPCPCQPGFTRSVKTLQSWRPRGEGTCLRSHSPSLRGVGEAIPMSPAGWVASRHPLCSRVEGPAGVHRAVLSFPQPYPRLHFPHRP